MLFQATFVAVAAGISGFVLGLQTVERLRAQEELEETVDELERSNERLDEFASVVSHDLRSPLNVAGIRLELAQQEFQSVHLEKIGTALDRMDRLIEDILLLAREGRRMEDPEPVRLSEVVDEAWAMTGETERQATLVTEVDRSATVVADAKRLRQLLENLFRNALDHGGPDVTVTVGTRRDGFCVADDGPGIPRADRETIFEAGYSTSDDGTGFGLKIVEQIADAHGWRITVETADAGGARFEFTGVDIHA